MLPIPNPKTALLLAGLISLRTIVFADGANQDLPPGAHGGVEPRDKAHHGGGGGNLIDHGGAILTAPSNFHFVWWGDWSAGAGTQSLLQNFLSGLSNTSLFQMMDQYTRSQSVVVGLSYSKTDYADTSAPPSHGPSVSTIVSEVCKVVTASGQPDPTAIYAVMTSNFPNGANYCAWHSSGSCSGQTIQVIYHPNPAAVQGCSTGVYPNNNPQADSTANTLSHEIFETITDPRGSAWYDQNGQEIGDKCAWTFSPVPGQNYTNTVAGLNYYIQREWSNAASGCVQNLH